LAATVFSADRVVSAIGVSVGRAAAATTTPSQHAGATLMTHSFTTW
jgi:hypothetical protein